MLVTMPCMSCSSKHDDRLQCDGCGTNYSFGAVLIKVYKDGDTHRGEKRFKFCPLCGLGVKKKTVKKEGN